MQKKDVKAADASVDDIDIALGMFIYGCNIPFNVVESKYFKEFVAVLNTSYKLPNRKTFSNTILDKVHDKVETERLKNLKGSEGTLLIDGWKNSSTNTKLVVCSIHNVNECPQFLESYDVSTVSETGLELANIVKDAINVAKEKYETTITAVVSDNASNMISMGNAVEIHHSTCNSHSGNLLAKSLVEKDYADKVNKILKAFKHPKLEREIVNRGGKRIVLPCETRWCSHRDSFSCLLENLVRIREIVNSGVSEIKEDVIQLINDETFEHQLIDFLIFFDPICALINECQKLSCSLANSVELWLKLNIPTQHQHHQQLLESRLKKVIKPIGLAANFLHPTLRGQLFSNHEEYTNMARDFLIINLNPDGLKELEDYTNKSGIFSLIYKKINDSSITFWETAKIFSPNLAQLALRLLKIPASTAQLERLFSNWAYVHNSIRNRLSPERSKMLINIYFSLRVRDSNYNYN